MTTRHWLTGVRVSSLVLMLAALASSANAQVILVKRSDARHSVGFNLGYFWLKGEDGRHEDDVLLRNQADLALRSRPDVRFEIGDFNNVTFGGEWVYGVSDFLETSVGLGYYQKKVPTLYRTLVNVNGSDILQDLKLKVLPITGTVRFLPLGRGAAVEPYIGGGIGLFIWRYSEIGEFVADNNDIFEARFIGDGTTLGPVAVGGVRFPVGDVWSAGAEFRWQNAEGDTSAVEGLLNDKIDLGGWTASFTLHVRF